MADYERAEARRWAREHLVGCSAVTSPTFTSNLKELNEAAIRHDIERVIEHGFTYTLLMTETAITPEEAGRFTAIARDQAGDRLRLFAHTAFGTGADTLEAPRLSAHPAFGPVRDNLEALRLSEQAGAALVLLASPPQFWPTSEQEIYDWTK